MTAVLSDKMGELRATTTEGFASLHRSLSEMSQILTAHGERLTRLETQRETADQLNRRFEDRNAGRRESDRQNQGLTLTRWQVVVAIIALVIAVLALVTTALIQLAAHA